jgi:hypothetical protein
MMQISFGAAHSFDEIAPAEAIFRVDCCLSCHLTTSHGYMRV